MNLERIRNWIETLPLRLRIAKGRLNAVFDWHAADLKRKFDKIDAEFEAKKKK